MRVKFVPFLFFWLSLTLAEPITAIWSLNIQARGGNTNGKEFVLWGESDVYKIDNWGNIIWRRSFSNLERAFLLPDGQCIVVTRQSNSYKLNFINLQGHNFWQFSSNNKVISIASRGKRVAMITDKGELYIFTLRTSPSRLKGWRRYNFHNALRALAILTDGRIVIAMPERMCIFEENKQPLFFPLANIQRIIPLNDGGFLTLIQQGEEVFLSRHNSSGYIVWSKGLKGEVSSLVSSFPFCSLGIEQRVGEDMEERKLFVFDQSGNIRWQRGGLLFKPVPLLLTSQGELLCTDEAGDKLLLFNQKGRYVWEKKCGGKIQGSITFYPSFALIIYDKGIEFIEVKIGVK